MTRTLRTLSFCVFPLYTQLVFGLLSLGLVHTLVFGLLSLSLVHTLLFGLLSLGLVHTLVYTQLVFGLLSLGLVHTLVFGLLSLGLVHTLVFRLLSLDLVHTLVFGLLSLGLVHTLVYTQLVFGLLSLGLVHTLGNTTDARNSFAIKLQIFISDYNLQGKVGRAFNPTAFCLSLSLPLPFHKLASDPKPAWSRTAAELCTFSVKGVRQAVDAVDTDTNWTCNDRCLSRHWFLTFCTRK